MAQQELSLRPFSEKVDCLDRFSLFCINLRQTLHAPVFSALFHYNTVRDTLSEREGPWWLDCCNATEKEARTILCAFKVHPLTVEDIIAGEQREKFEAFNNYYFISFTSLDAEHHGHRAIEPVQMNIIVFSFGMITFHSKPLSQPMHVRRRIRHLQKRYDLNTTWICYALVDALVESYRDNLFKAECEVDTLEDCIYIDHTIVDDTSMLKQISRALEYTDTLSSLMTERADTIAAFAQYCVTEGHRVPTRKHWLSDIAMYLDDIEARVKTMTDSLETSSTIINRLYRNYLAYKQTTKRHHTNRITVITHTVTVLGTMFFPTHFILSLWTMNVYVPGDGNPSDWRWFFGIFGTCLGFFALSVLVAKLLFNRRMRKY